MHEAVARQLFEKALTDLGDELCATRGWRVLLREYPSFEVEFVAQSRTTIRVRFTCDGWNDQPPSITWLDADGNFLTAIPQGAGGQLNNGAHPTTGRPFVCMVGSREYHSHPGHLGDVWENHKHRSGYDLGGILTQVWRAWREARP